MLCLRIVVLKHVFLCRSVCVTVLSEKGCPKSVLTQYKSLNAAFPLILGTGHVGLTRVLKHLCQQKTNIILNTQAWPALAQNSAAPPQSQGSISIQEPGALQRNSAGMWWSAGGFCLFLCLSDFTLPRLRCTQILMLSFKYSGSRRWTGGFSV